MEIQSCLPPGFRFHPTDYELLSYYLLHKVFNPSFTHPAIGEADLNKCEPWNLPERAKQGEKEWYFYSLQDRKYPTGARANRGTKAGYWKSTGRDKQVMNPHTSCLLGMKKTLVFYKGRAPKGEKTNWVMHEYRLEAHHLPHVPKNEWVICRILYKGKREKKPPTYHTDIDVLSMGLPPLLDCNTWHLNCEGETTNSYSSCINSIPQNNTWFHNSSMLESLECNDILKALADQWPNTVEGSTDMKPICRLEETEQNLITEEGTHLRIPDHIACYTSDLESLWT